MVISVKETTVFAVFHPDAHDLYNTCSDLKKVAWELWDPKRRLGAEVSLPDTSSICALFTSYPDTFRTRPFNFSELSHLCSVNDPRKRLKNLSRRWRVGRSSWKRSSTANVFSCINVGTNISIVPGVPDIHPGEPKY